MDSRHLLEGGQGRRPAPAAEPERRPDQLGRLGGCLAALVLLATAGSAWAAPWLSPGVGAKPGEPAAKALASSFPGGPIEVPTTTGQHRALRSCDDYFAAAKAGVVSDSLPAVDYNALLLQGAKCKAIQLSGSAKPASRSFLPAAGFAGVRTSELPSGFYMAISPDDEARLAKLRSASLAKADSQARVVAANGDSLKLKGSGWEGSYRIYLRGVDLNGDGLEDMLVDAGEGVTDGGTLATVQLLYVTRTSPTSPWVVFKHSP